MYVLLICLFSVIFFSLRCLAARRSKACACTQFVALVVQGFIKEPSASFC